MHTQLTMDDETYILIWCAAFLILAKVLHTTCCHVAIQFMRYRLYKICKYAAASFTDRDT